MTLNEELIQLRQQVKKQEKEIIMLGVYLLFSVAYFFTVHEHLHKVHNLPKKRQSFL
jgi:hypothetical protein